MISIKAADVPIISPTRDIFFQKHTVVKRTWSSLLQGECLEQPATDDAVPRCGKSSIALWSLPCTQNSIYKDAAFNLRVRRWHMYTSLWKWSFLHELPRCRRAESSICQLMIDEQHWAGGHFFYQFVKFSRGCRIKKTTYVRRWRRADKPVFFGGLGTICIWFVCQMQA